jgi:hypothetical protein
MGALNGCQRPSWLAIPSHSGPRNTCSASISSHVCHHPAALRNRLTVQWAHRELVLARGYFPDEQAALRCLYPVTRPGRHRSDQTGDARQAGHQRLRRHLRRPVPGRRDLLANRREHRQRDKTPTWEDK